MYNNISIESLQRSLRGQMKYFDPEKDVYKALNKCVNDKTITPEKMLNELSKIGDMKDFPVELQRYFYERRNELESLQRITKERDELRDSVLKEKEDLSKEFASRGIPNTLDFQYNKKEKGETYLQISKEVKELKHDNEIIKQQLLNLNSVEKISGEKFEGFEDKVKNFDNREYNFEQDRIQENASKNKELKENLSADNLVAAYNFYHKNQTDLSKLDISIDFQGDSYATIKFSYKGTNVNESYPSFECSYSDMRLLNTAYKELLSAYMGESNIENLNTNGSNLSGENIDGETLNVSAPNHVIDKVNSDINELEENRDKDEDYLYVDGSRTNNKGIVRTRKKPEMYNNRLGNSGFNNRGIYIVLLFSVIVSVLLIVCLLLFK